MKSLYNGDPRVEEVTPDGKYRIPNDIGPGSWLVERFEQWWLVYAPEGAFEHRAATLDEAIHHVIHELMSADKE